MVLVGGGEPSRRRGLVRGLWVIGHALEGDCGALALSQSLCFLTDEVSGFTDLTHSHHDVLPCHRIKAIEPIAYELEPPKL